MDLENVVPHHGPTEGQDDDLDDGVIAGAFKCALVVMPRPWSKLLTRQLYSELTGRGVHFRAPADLNRRADLPDNLRLLVCVDMPREASRAIEGLIVGIPVLGIRYAEFAMAVNFLNQRMMPAKRRSGDTLAVSNHEYVIRLMPEGTAWNVITVTKRIFQQAQDDGRHDIKVPYIRTIVSRIKQARLREEKVRAGVRQRPEPVQSSVAHGGQDHSYLAFGLKPGAVPEVPAELESKIRCFREMLSKWQLFQLLRHHGEGLDLRVRSCYIARMFQIYGFFKNPGSEQVYKWYASPQAGKPEPLLAGNRPVKKTA